jgi:hypothetical protein
MTDQPTPRFLCKVLAFPDGRFRCNDYLHRTVEAINLAGLANPHVQTRLSTEIYQSGDLVVWGQEVGPLVGSFWGVNYYDYWVRRITGWRGRLRDGNGGLYRRTPSSSCAGPANR